MFSYYVQIRGPDSCGLTVSHSLLLVLICDICYLRVAVGKRLLSLPIA